MRAVFEGYSSASALCVPDSFIALHIVICFVLSRFLSGIPPFAFRNEYSSSHAIVLLRSLAAASLQVMKQKAFQTGCLLANGSTFGTFPWCQLPFSSQPVLLFS